MSTDRSHLTKKSITDVNGKQTTVHVNDQKGDGSTNASLLSGLSPRVTQRSDSSIRTVVDMYGDVIDQETVTTKGDDVLTAEGYEVRYEDSYENQLSEGEQIDFMSNEYLSQIGSNVHSVTVTRLSYEDSDKIAIDVDRYENLLRNNTDDEDNDADALSEEYVESNARFVERFFAKEYNAEVYTASSWENTNVSMRQVEDANTLTDTRVMEIARDMNEKFERESDPGESGSDHYVPKMKAYIEQERGRENAIWREVLDPYDPLDPNNDIGGPSGVPSGSINNSMLVNNPISSFGDGTVGAPTREFFGRYDSVKQDDGSYESNEYGISGWEPVSFGDIDPVVPEGEFVSPEMSSEIMKNPGNYVITPVNRYDGNSFEGNEDGMIVLREQSSPEEFAKHGFVAREE